MYLHKRYLDSQLNPGTLTTPGRFCLVLLRSRPDTVHRFPSHETRIFNVAYQGQLCRSTPSAQYHPCYSGLQVQGTASTPAARVLILQCFIKKVNGLRKSYSLQMKNPFSSPFQQLRNMKKLSIMERACERKIRKKKEREKRVEKRQEAEDERIISSDQCKIYSFKSGCI